MCSCFKDGTTRVDSTDVPLTHFRPSEVGSTSRLARSLGYVKDHLGKELETPDQLVELKVQDVVIPTACTDYMIRTSNFIDDMLVKFYGSIHTTRSRSKATLWDISWWASLLTHLGECLPRIVGFSQAHAGYAHPFFHAAKRRNCDGDEDSIILLLDCLLNFSRAFLPEKRGGLMDAPLVLTTKLDRTRSTRRLTTWTSGAGIPWSSSKAPRDSLTPRRSSR